MRTRLSDGFVLAVKDRLRSVRYRIKRDARGETPMSDHTELLVPGSVAFATDAVFTRVEAAAAALLPKDEVALYAYPFPQPLAAYFAPDPQDPHALTPKIYSALKALLRRFGSDVFLVSEQAVHEACEAVRASQAHTIAAALEPSSPAADRFDASVRLCAALTVALVAARPVREVMRGLQTRATPKAPFVTPNEYCALVAGLAIALSSRADLAGADRQGLAEAADLAVHARLGELLRAFKSRQPAAELAAEFNDLLRFLP